MGKDFPSFSYTFIFIKTCLSSVKKKKKTKAKEKEKTNAVLLKMLFEYVFLIRFTYNGPLIFSKK